MITDDILSKPIPSIPQEAVDALNRATAKRQGSSRSSNKRNLPSSSITTSALLQQQHTTRFDEPNIVISNNNTNSNNINTSSPRRISSSLPRVSSAASSSASNHHHIPRHPPPPSSSSSHQHYNQLPRVSSTTVLRRNTTTTSSNHHQSNNLLGVSTRSTNNNNNSPPENSMMMISDLAFATEHSDRFQKEQLQKHKMHSSFRSLLSSPQQNRNPTSPENTQQSIAEETRQFARKQLAEFRSAEERRTESYRQLRTGLRNIETIIQDIPISDQLAKDVREKPPTEQTIHLQIVNTAMHRKITELTELLEMSVKTEDNLRKRLALSEARVASAENKIIDLQAKLFEAELMPPILKSW